MVTRGVDPVFLDTSLLVAASVESHPGHLAAEAYIKKLEVERAPLCLSLQVCREFLVVLTRQPLGGRSFSVQEALTALEGWRSICAFLEENESVLTEWLRLLQKYSVRGKQVHDCNIVAVMLAHGVNRLGTRNPADFERYADEIQIEPVVS